MGRFVVSSGVGLVLSGRNEFVCSSRTCSSSCSSGLNSTSGDVLAGFAFLRLTDNRGQDHDRDPTGSQTIPPGEDKIMAAMRRFANDSKCLDALEAFQKEVPVSMAEYRKAIVENERNKLVAKAQKQLQSILSFEDAGNAKLQESVVREVATEFRAKFGKTTAMQDAAFDSAISMVEGGKDAAAQDPVTKHFLESLSSIDLSGKAAAKVDGTVSERLAWIQATQEAEFVKTFYVSKEEAAGVGGGRPSCSRPHIVRMTKEESVGDLCTGRSSYM